MFVDVGMNVTATLDKRSVNLGSDNAGIGVGVEDRSSISKSVKGSFHQADDGFKYGVQCMAVGLASLSKHTFDSGFSRETKRSG